MPFIGGHTTATANYDVASLRDVNTHKVSGATTWERLGMKLLSRARGQSYAQVCRYAACIPVRTKLYALDCSERAARPTRIWAISGGRVATDIESEA